MFELLISLAEIEAVFRAWVDNAIRFLPQIALAVAVFVLATILAGVARRSTQRSFARASGDQRAGNAMGTLASYLVLFLGAIVALAVAGVDLAAMMLAVGAIGFGLAFAMQDTMANLIAGFLILLSRPFARDDAVEVNGAQGVVQEITMRSTKLKTFDGLKVEVPNRQVISNNITVFSEHPTRRYDVGVGIGYDDDISGAVETARQAAQGVQDVLDDPPVEVFVGELGGSSVDLTVRFWQERSDRASMLQIKGEVTQAVKEALVDAGYDIPFPIRTIYMHQEDGNGSNA